MRNMLGAALRDCEVAIAQVRKEVTSLEEFHNNVDVVLVFKHVIKTDDAWMLADLEHFNFSLEQFKIFQAQFFLLDDLDCALSASSLVDCLLDKSVLAFAQVIFQFIEVVQVSVADSNLDCSHPLVLVLLGKQIINAPFVREYKHKRVVLHAALNHVFDLILEVDTGKRLHFLVLEVALLLVAVEFLAEEDEPVLLDVARFFLFLENLAFNVHGIFSFAAVAARHSRSAWQTAGTVLDYVGDGELAIGTRGVETAADHDSALRVLVLLVGYNLFLRTCTVLKHAHVNIFIVFAFELIKRNHLNVFRSAELAIMSLISIAVIVPHNGDLVVR